ncbi:MAG TPA: phosphoribosylamine--glycine ligase [Longimicrobiales bacterium]|nr:phosphoribosylamine--glycine ligase [Longimicrobiales bacterium]
MKVLIIGAGGREHALLWKLRRDAPDAELYVTGGNGGTAGLATSLPFSPDDMNGLAGWAEAQAVDLAIVGPEAPLAAGIVDVFLRHELPVFGPTQAAAAIESSKSFAKQLMVRYGVPTAAHASFTELAAAERHIRARGAPIVVKASGLAAGKGAVVCERVEEALAAAREMLSGQAFGEAGQEVVIEACMTGEELSVFAITDGERVLPMLPAQDHKRIGEGDTGPNTGGMGAYAPVSLVDAALMERIQADIFEPTLAGLREEKRPFRGLLYAGLMLTPEGPKVVEFNCRFGDPETQALLPLLSSSLLEPLGAVARGESLEGVALEWADAAAVTTVLASRGYPASSEKGVPIRIPAELEGAGDVHVFHAGTALEDGRLVTAGGRVLAVTAVAPDLPRAAARGREAAEAIAFDGKQYRRDIGWRELERLQAPRPR